jgi:hypothetical protein
VILHAKGGKLVHKLLDLWRKPDGGGLCLLALWFFYGLPKGAYLGGRFMRVLLGLHRVLSFHCEGGRQGG